MKSSRFLPSQKGKRCLSTTDKDYFNRKGPWDEKDLGSLLDANKAWKQRMIHQQPDFFKEIKRGHAPKILWIGCSDARVPANEIIGEPPGSVFVHRNIANMVVNTDFNVMSVIQFAVTVLKVKHIIVCGHYDCGGVKASLETNDYASPLCNWLRNIRDTYRLHRDELNRIEDIRLRQRRLVELNVVEQVRKHILCFYLFLIILFV
jgi:carbonic anhydrase